MKKILICGATGFIGRNLTKYFADRDEFEVYAVWNQRPSTKIDNVTWVQGDLRKTGDVERLVEGMDIIVQAAATTSGSKDIVNRPHIHVTDNAVMNSLLLRAAFDHHVKHFVFFSCTVMYQSSAKALSETDFDASEELHSRYYGVGWTKVYVEKMCDFFSKLGRTKHSVIRHSNIYGPYDKFDLERSHVFGATITKVLASNSNELDVWGDGSEKRDLLYVSDLVSLVETIIEKQKDRFELLNIGYGDAISIKDLIEKIITISGKNLELRFDTTKPTVKFDLALNIDKVRTKYKWRPNVALDEGIKNTISWYMENITIT